MITPLNAISLINGEIRSLCNVIVLVISMKIIFSFLRMKTLNSALKEILLSFDYRVLPAFPLFITLYLNAIKSIKLVKLSSDGFLGNNALQRK